MKKTSEKAASNFTHRLVLAENSLEQIKNLINETDSLSSLKEMMTRNVKRVKVEFSQRPAGLRGILFSGFFSIHNYLNDMNVGDIRILDETEMEFVEAHSILESMKYSLLNIPIGGAGLYLSPDFNRLTHTEKSKVIKEFLLMLSDDILSEDVYLSLAGMKNDDNYSLMIKALNETESPKKSQKLSFLLGTPSEIGGITEVRGMEERWIENILTKLLNEGKKKKLKVLIHGVNPKAISLAKHLKCEGYTVLGIGESGYSVYSAGGLSEEDIDSSAGRGADKKIEIDYYDFLKIKADIFVEISGEYSINDVTAEILNVSAVAEITDFAILEYPLKILKKKKISVIPSVLLSASKCIYDYLEIIQKKRGESMTEEEVELRFESYQSYVERILERIDLSDESLTEELYGVSMKNYERKYGILCADKE